MNPQYVVPESDRELLDGLARGEPRAIAAVYQRNGARMIAFARRYVKDEGAAEDVVIGLLGRWLERPPRVREVERMSAFLATSVYHAAVDWIRRERAAQGQPPRLRADETAPRTPVAREDMHGRLSGALDQLPPGERFLLENHYGNALTTEECMERLGISRAAFHQRLHRARTHLAALMSEKVQA